MNKKLPKNAFIFSDTIYCQDFVFVLTRSHEKFRRIMDKYLSIDIKPTEADCSGEFYGLQHKNKGTLGVIWVSDKCSIVHEVFHATAWVMLNRGVNLDIHAQGAEESWAYYIAYLYREIMAGLH